MTPKWKMTIEIIIDGSRGTPADFGELTYRIFDYVSPDGKSFKFARVILEPIYPEGKKP
jgi:hypothetical protein